MFTHWKMTTRFIPSDYSILCIAIFSHIDDKSELRGATSNFLSRLISTALLPSVPKNLLAQFSQRIDYLQLSPTIQNLLNDIYTVLEQCRCTIWLLAPRPYLIAKFLQRQCRLPYWPTKVCNSHQLIPNLANASVLNLSERAELYL